jgi:hypothetical protein
MFRIRLPRASRIVDPRQRAVGPGRISFTLRRLGTLGAIAIAVGACSSSAGFPVNVAPQPPVQAAPTAAPTAAPARGTAAGVSDGETSGGAGGDGSDPAIDTSGPLIVRTGSLSLEVTDLDATLLQARGRIVGLGGYVSDSEQTGGTTAGPTGVAGQDTQATPATALITYRIPAAHWDEALDALKGFASRIVSEDTKAADVTGQVYDLGARIDNLKATERALQTIMTQATKISDILDVQNQLTTVQGQIEELSTQQAHLGDQAALGTLAVTYTVPVAPVVAVTQATSGWSLASEIDHAEALLVQLGQGIAVVAVWLGIVGLPILLGCLVVLGLALFVARRFAPRREAATPNA